MMTDCAQISAMYLPEIDRRSFSIVLVICVSVDIIVQCCRTKIPYHLISNDTQDPRKIRIL